MDCQGRCNRLSVPLTAAEKEELSRMRPSLRGEMLVLLDPHQKRLTPADLAYKRLGRLIILGSAAAAAYFIFQLIRCFS